MRTITLSLSLLLVAALLPAAGGPEGVETFMANVVAVSSPRGMVTDTVVLRVERWTKPEEARILYNVLGEKGMQGFQKALNEQDLGRVAATASIGLPINLATSEQTPDGRSIRLIVERPLLQRELSKIERSSEYPFIVVEFTMDAAGGGKGRIIPAAKFRLDRNGALEISAYSEPNEEKIISVKKVEPK